jgi:hypothetical protein
MDSMRTRLPRLRMMLTHIFCFFDYYPNLTFAYLHGIGANRFFRCNRTDPFNNVKSVPVPWTEQLSFNHFASYQWRPAVCAETVESTKLTIDIENKNFPLTNLHYFPASFGNIFNVCDCLIHVHAPFTQLFTPFGDLGANIKSIDFGNHDHSTFGQGKSATV